MPVVAPVDQDVERNEMDEDFSQSITTFLLFEKRIL